MSARRRIICWYSFCRAYFKTPVHERAPVTRQVLAQYRAIDRLPPDLGASLDRRGAPQVVVRWIAWARDYKQMETRFAIATEYNALTGGWPPWDDLWLLEEERA